MVEDAPNYIVPDSVATASAAAQPTVVAAPPEVVQPVESARALRQGRVGEPLREAS